MREIDLSGSGEGVADFEKPVLAEHGFQLSTKGSHLLLRKQNDFSLFRIFSLSRTWLVWLLERMGKRERSGKRGRISAKAFGGKRKREK